MSLNATTASSGGLVLRYVPLRTWVLALTDGAKWADDVGVCGHGQLVGFPVRRVARGCQLDAERAGVLVCRLHDHLVSFLVERLWKTKGERTDMGGRIVS
jgi:hypothetical protein